MVASAKVLQEALRLPAAERIRLAEALLNSADADVGSADDDEAIQLAWADEVRRRSIELKDGSVRGLDPDQARRILVSDSSDDR